MLLQELIGPECQSLPTVDETFRCAEIVGAFTYRGGMTAGKKILYIDMDNTLVDFSVRLEGIDQRILDKFHDRHDEIPGVFAVMPPVAGAIEAFNELSQLFDTYILSTAPWSNPSAWLHKIEWVHLHFGDDEASPAYKRLILSHHKDLNRGDFLIDDRPKKNGAGKFTGDVIHFGSDGIGGWDAVLEYLRPRA